MSGIRTSWERGPREQTYGRDQRGRDVLLVGKHGGPVVKQSVVKVLTPKRGDA